MSRQYIRHISREEEFIHMSRVEEEELKYEMYRNVRINNVSTELARPVGSLEQESLSLSYKDTNCSFQISATPKHREQQLCHTF